MGSYDQIDFDALVGNIKSEGEKRGENITASLWKVYFKTMYCCGLKTV